MPSKTFLQDTTSKLEKEGIVFLRIKIRPSSPKNEIKEIFNKEEPTIKICIVAPPEKGKANKELCKFLGKMFNCQCKIVSGKSTALKLIKLSRESCI